MIRRMLLLVTLAGVPAATMIGCSEDVTSPTDDSSSLDDLVILPSSDTILIGRTLQFRAERGGEIVSVDWSETSPAIDLLGTSTGVVRGIEAGEAVVTARLRTDSSIRATATIQVEPQPIDSVEVFPTEITLTVGERFTLVAAVQGAPGVDAEVTWNSGDSLVATVSSAGRVDPRQVGRTVISASAVGDPGKKGFCLVEVIAAN